MSDKSQARKHQESMWSKMNKTKCSQIKEGGVNTFKNYTTSVDQSVLNDLPGHGCTCLDLDKAEFGAAKELQAAGLGWIEWLSAGQKRRRKTFWRPKKKMINKIEENCRKCTHSFYQKPLVCMAYYKWCMVCGANLQGVSTSSASPRLYRSPTSSEVTVTLNRQQLVVLLYDKCSSYANSRRVTNHSLSSCELRDMGMRPSFATNHIETARSR